MNNKRSFSEQDFKRKNYLKQRRVLLNMTQQDVAERAKVSLRTYQSYEQDVRQPSIQVALRIARALRIDCESLWEAFEDEPQTNNKYFAHIESRWSKE
jgi:Predicted transcriptional regulators